MHTGCPMNMVARIPHQKQLDSIKSISEKAKKKLTVIDWYNLKSKIHSSNHKKNVTLTCRHFGLSRSTFYYWYKSYDSRNLYTLEEKSRKPKHTRGVKYGYETVREIKKIRKENHLFDGVKIHKIMLRYKDKEEVPSSATINRIIRKYNMFYADGNIRKHKELSRKAKANNRNRIEYMTRATKPCEIIEFDMKHICSLGGKKMYAMCGIDQFTRKAVIHITSSPSSRSAVIALQKIVGKFGKGIKIHNDNGSENMGKAEEWLKTMNVEQYFARPRKPKDKPFVERFIGTFQREFLDENRILSSVKELQEKADGWMNAYENFRPHKSLNLLTPTEFEDNFYLSVGNSARLSNM